MDPSTHCRVLLRRPQGTIEKCPTMLKSDNRPFYEHDIDFPSEYLKIIYLTVVQLGMLILRYSHCISG